MKLLKIFGIVAGIHVVALIMIFANPGCSTTSKRANPSETVIPPTSDAVVTVPHLSSGYQQPETDYASTRTNATDAASPITNAPLMFNPDAVAVAGDGRYSPTRPNTPVATALKAEPVDNVVPASTYTVVRGDSLWSIAKRNGLSVADLSAANNLRASATLQLGQKLIIPGKANALNNESTPPLAAPSVKPLSAVAVTPKGNKESITHTVVSGETLGAIARKYQVRIGDVATANNISDPAKIRPGQTLIIPGTTAAASAPVTKVVKPVEAAPAPIVTQPVENANNPIIFIPPPMDRPLDEGFLNDPGDAPVIKVEEAPATQAN
ncbi:MAG: LysM peptidoglycan-binding domain-containing protein [Cephaloticoccus sp.]|nr:LysM peptidoglycan-binding domain-containing protein [Cephaloticoccus sp.]MCF7760165.1 LysM peptidoglycan-binding domain-containing protein [Cephaloticoccus sp.]